MSTLSNRGDIEALIDFVFAGRGFAQKILWDEAS